MMGGVRAEPGCTQIRPINAVGDQKMKPRDRPFTILGVVSHASHGRYSQTAVEPPPACCARVTHTPQKVVRIQVTYCVGARKYHTYKKLLRTKEFDLARPPTPAKPKRM